MPDLKSCARKGVRVRVPLRVCPERQCGGTRPCGVVLPRAEGTDRSVFRPVLSTHSPLPSISGDAVRTVADEQGTTWICLELPEVPVDQRAAAAALASDDVVAIECNSGAHRVIALVPTGWDDDMDDARLNAVIREFLERR